MPDHSTPVGDAPDRPPLDDDTEAHVKAVHERADLLCPAEHRWHGDINKIPCADCYRAAQAQIDIEEARDRGTEPGTP